MKRPAITPPWAAKVWVEDDKIYAELPVPHSHVVSFPNEYKGLSQLLKLVRSRTAESKIGEKGDLTQYQLDKALIAKAIDEGKITWAKPKAQFTAKERITAREILRGMGLI